jgi:hypothetical protein
MTAPPRGAIHREKDKPDPEDEIDLFVIPITVGVLVAM